MCQADQDIEREPLIPRNEDQHNSKNGGNPVPGTVANFLGICRGQSRVLLTKLDMASMQSPRTQCCCCAIGVFAAMFGIFMLSAGICIVLNVNYMEVDTSGLPPDLHNEDGKKIVGIILICVSLCTLGLSAAVSIVYFAFCNRSRPRHAHVTSSSNGANHSNGSVQHQSASSLPVGNGGHHHYPNNKHISKVAAMHGAKAGGGGNGGARGTPPGSQTSLNAGGKWKQPGVSSSGVLVPTPPHSQSPSSGKKRGRRNMPKKSKTHQRHMNRLPTHTEEDPEAAKSIVDLKSHRGPSAENSSNSGSSMAPSHIGSTIADDLGHGSNYSTTSFINTPQQGTSGSGIKASPVIIIDGPTSPAVVQTSGDESLFYSGNPHTSSKDNSLESDSKIADSTVVYNENEIARTSEKMSSPSSASVHQPHSSSSSSSPNAQASNPYGSIINSHSSSKESSSYFNPAFQGDGSNNGNDSKTAGQPVVSLDHDTSECNIDDSIISTPPLSNRFSHSTPLKPPSSSDTSDATATSNSNQAKTPFPQYPGSEIAGVPNTYPTPLISAGLDLEGETDLDQTSLPGDQDSTASSNHNIVQVKPHHQQSQPSSPSATNTARQPQSESRTGSDVSSALPQSSRHHELYHRDSVVSFSGSTSSNNTGSSISKSQYTVNISNNNIDNLENRSESRSSFNSTISTDGEERDDIEKIQEKLKGLLE